MNKKYYTPLIEEFHVGFECEWQSKIRNETWNKQICDVDLISIAYDTIEHADEDEPYEEQFRVKYLDKYDIQNEGYILKRKSIDLWFEKEEIHLREDGYHLKNIKLQYALHDKRLKVIFHYTSGEEQIHFEGEIKNKTEFKRILKQLGLWNK